MGPVVEQLVLWVLKKVLTADVIKGAEAEFIAFLRALADKTPSKIDNTLVEILAQALGVP